jgi:hypothetical protein
VTTVSVVGGVYWERCDFPIWNELFGSAGRAAKALAEIGVDVELHTALTKRELIHANTSLATENLKISLLHERQAEISFEYLHPLAEPTIKAYKSVSTQKTKITAQTAIVFGMLECSPTVSAMHCIYDPQSPSAPQPFSAIGSDAKHLAIVANSNEILRLAKSSSIDDAAKSILKSENAQVVVVKNGIKGALVYTHHGVSMVPAYRTDSAFTIGSGDMFVAAFGYAWAVLEKAPTEATEYASRSVARYLESRIAALRDFEETLSDKREKVEPSSAKIYLAGPFREIGQRMLINDIRTQLSRLGLKVFSPVHDIGRGDFHVVVPQDLAAIRECDAVFAIMNGLSPGTMFEIGYAAAVGKRLYCLAENIRAGDLKLPQGVGATIGSDLVSLVFKVATDQ